MSDPYAQVAAVFASRGVPDYIWRSIMEAESGGNPNARGDNGKSIGLFQLNTAGGQGSGYEPYLLQDPLINAQIAANPIAEAWNAVKGLGLSPSQEAMQVAIRSGHPGGSVQTPATHLLSDSRVQRIGAYASEFTTGGGGDGANDFAGLRPFQAAPPPGPIRIAGITLPNFGALGSQLQQSAQGITTSLQNPLGSLQSVGDFFANLNKDLTTTDWRDVAIRASLIIIGISFIMLVLTLILSEQYTKATQPIVETAGGISTKAGE